MFAEGGVVEGTPFGRYRMIELLGRGGMGEVWRAFDTAIDRVVALKVLPAAFADDQVFQERFRREARAAAGLDEPHVVPIHDFGEIDGRLYVTMRLIDGRDVQTMLAGGPLEPARAVSIIEQIASALQAAHRIGLVHRDVKPSNILVAEEDFAYLIDFGIAHATGETGLTATGNVIGSWAYLAPERLTEGLTDPRADIYALTCVLHECLTGSQPFPSNSLEQQIAAHVSKPPPRPSVLCDTVPAELDTVIAKGMAKNPDERYSTTREMAQAARAAITDPMVRPASMWPTESARHVEYDTQRGGPPPMPQNAQVSATGGVSPSAYTQQRPATDPHLGGPGPSGAGQAPAKKFFRKRAAILGVASVIAVLAVVAGLVVSNRSDSSSTTNITTERPTAVPNTGPFTGTFTADFGPELDRLGEPYKDQTRPPYQETWRLRSACGSNGCVATAATGGQFPAKEVVFDDFGGRWLAVATSPGKCKEEIDDERWQVISLQPRPDGTMVGEWTNSAMGGCYYKRTVTFTRTGDTDVASLADPTDQPPRVVSPAEALHGRYDSETSFSSGGTQHEADFSVRTDCLRTGDRCMSLVVSPELSHILVFGNGRWTRSSEFDASCSLGGTRHVKWNAEFPLPQPPQDPITLLTGRGHSETTGDCGSDNDFDQKYVRTGD